MNNGVKIMKKHIVIDLEGETEHDIRDALNEAIKDIKKQFSSGFNSNDTGRYHFKVTEA